MAADPTHRENLRSCTLLGAMVVGWFCANTAAASGTTVVLGGTGTGSLAALSAMQLAATWALCAALTWGPWDHAVTPQRTGADTGAAGLSAGKAADEAPPSPRTLPRSTAKGKALLSGSLFATGTYFTNASLAAGGVVLTQTVKAAEPLAAVVLATALLRWPPHCQAPPTQGACKSAASHIHLVGASLSVAMLIGGVVFSVGASASKPTQHASPGLAAISAAGNAIISGVSLQLRNIVLKHFKEASPEGSGDDCEAQRLLPDSTYRAAVKGPAKPLDWTQLRGPVAYVEIRREPTTPSASKGGGGCSRRASAAAEFMPTCAAATAVLCCLLLAHRALDGAAASLKHRVPDPPAHALLGNSVTTTTPHGALALAVGGFAVYQTLSFAVLRVVDPVRHAALGNAKRVFVTVAGAALVGKLAGGASRKQSRLNAGVVAGALLTMVGAHLHTKVFGGERGGATQTSAQARPRGGARHAVAAFNWCIVAFALAKDMGWV